MGKGRVEKKGEKRKEKKMFKKKCSGEQQQQL